MKRTFRRSVAASAALLSLVLAPASAHAQSLNLSENETPTSPFGKGAASATYGQTFMAPAGGNFLQTFSFWLGDDANQNTTNSSSLLFQAYVMQWDAASGHATGPALFTSSVVSGPTSFAQRYDFASPNVAMTAGTQYVAFLSASESFGAITQTEATAYMETSLLGTYTGGAFVFTDNGSDFSALTTTTWDFTGFPEYQAHFFADFSTDAVSVVPEPSSLVLLVTGLSALMLLAARKKRV